MLHNDTTDETVATQVDNSNNNNNRHHTDDSQGEQDNSDDDDGSPRDDSDNLSLGSTYSNLTSNSRPPTYVDIASILGNTRPPITGTGVAAARSGSGHGNGTSLNRIPLNVPSPQEMESLPNDVVALILETLTVLEIFDLHLLSDRWRQLTTRALLDKFTMSSVVLWMDQESHRAFRPVFLFDSFDETTNRIRWLPKPTHRVEGRGQVYSKTFGITKPTLRIISVGDVDKFDYLEKEAHIHIQNPGTRTLLGTDKGCPWAFIYKVSKFTRHGKRVRGERWIEPISFECHLDFLNPRSAHKLRLLWYLQKSYKGIPLVNGQGVAATHAAAAANQRTRVEGAMASSEMTTYFNNRMLPTPILSHS